MNRYMLQRRKDKSSQLWHYCSRSKYSRLKSSVKWMMVLSSVKCGRNKIGNQKYSKVFITRDVINLPSENLHVIDHENFWIWLNSISVKCKKELKLLKQYFHNERYNKYTDRKFIVCWPEYFWIKYSRLLYRH